MASRHDDVGRPADPRPASAGPGGPAGRPTTVVNVSRRRCDELIDRNTDFGNPFFLGPDGSREAVLAKFRAYALRRMETDPAWAARVRALKGKRLGCHCKPKACHGDVYVEILDGASSS
ncbi:DUF4326 domain-containing protein [bacterium]|nr:DUF4326 domain-containing protein [bacterium]